MNRNFLCLLVSSALIAGCGGSGPEPIPVKVTVDDPNSPARSSSDLTSGKHLDTSIPPQGIAVPAPSLKEDPPPSPAQPLTSSTSTDVQPPQTVAQVATPTADPMQTEDHMYDVTCDQNGVCTRLSKTPKPPTEAHIGSKSKLYCDAGAQPGGVLPADCPTTYYPL